MIEDRRGEGSGGLGGFPGLGGGGGQFPIPLPGGSGARRGGIGLIGVLILVVVVTMFLRPGGGLNIPSIDTPAMPSADGTLKGAPDPDAELVDFLGFVMEDTQLAWQDLFQRDGRTYQNTTLVLFEGATETGCGLGSEETGPFYCPIDRKLYLDLDFFRELHNRFGAPGDFAQAYVVAHEIGHHVQVLFGTSDRVREAQEQSPGEANDLSVRLELQADCYAGVWAHSAYDDQLLESGDLEEGLAAAAAVGDDRIQRSAGRDVNPETWTHGSSAQRQEWFKHGFQEGDPGDCDTFSASI
jgi:predicted metalloprotease